MRLLAALALGFGLAPFPCAAQAAPPPAADLQHVVGREVRIRDYQKREIVGMLRGVTDSNLTVDAAGGVVVVPFERVWKLDRRGDSVADGAMVGAVLPVVSFFFGGGQGYDSAADAQVGLVMSVVMCAALGAGLDALDKGWTNVFRADRSRRTAFAVLPARRGVRVAFTRAFK